MVYPEESSQVIFQDTINMSKVTLDIEDYTYTGKVITPKISVKYLTTIVGRVSENTFDEVTMLVGKALGCYVEKEVEVLKEVPADTSTDLELALLKQKVEIYERLIFERGIAK